MVYLKANVVLEPLFQRWYAWPHLIPPATAAMNIVNRHFKIMDSFIQAPALHERFARDPQMVGGPFMGHPATRKEEVRALRDETRRDFPHLIELAAAIDKLHRLVDEEATGGSLDGLYAKLPETLHGYVELVYDLANQPGFRFFEPLLYSSRFYDTSAQSIALYELDQDARPFVLSTPRLDDKDVVHIHVPFAHPGIDALFRMRTCPDSYEKIRDQLGVPPADARFRSLFSETAPPASPARATRNPDQVELRYFGHACLLIEADGLTILTDPVISATAEGEVARDTYLDLPDHIDYVLITHGHQDHILFETLLQLRHKIGRIVVPRNDGGSLQDPSLKLMFNAVGFADVIELDELGRLSLPQCTITGVPFVGEHSDLRILSKLCYHVEFPGKFSVLLAADSCNVAPALYEHVHALIGDVDMLFLGMECDGAPLSWLYGPLLPKPLPRNMDQARRLAGSNYPQGMALIEQFRPSQVYVYAMGQEPWLRHIMGLVYTPQSAPIVASDALVDACRDRGISAKRLFGREVICNDR